jgi:predicted RNA-binding Zn ribbon-like protein
MNISPRSSIVSIDYSGGTFQLTNTIDPYAEAFMNLLERIPYRKIRECLTPGCNRWLVHKGGRQEY